MRGIVIVSLAIVLLLFASGCIAQAEESSAARIVFPTPTLLSLFEEDSSILSQDEVRAGEEVVPTVASIFLAPDLSPIPPTTTPLPSRVVVTPQERTEQSFEYIVYGEGVNSDWGIIRTPGMRVEEIEGAPAHGGSKYLSATPERAWSTLYFAVQPDSSEVYQRDDVLGVSLWINSGDLGLDTDEMSMTVIGSNDYPYFVPGDNSVYTDEVTFFSESKLYYLGVNRFVPPNTWVELVTMLDNLPFDPDYQYVTGVYIKNNEGMNHTILIDDLSLIMASDEPIGTGRIEETTIELLDPWNTEAAETPASVVIEVTATLTLPAATPTLAPAPTSSVPVGIVTANMLNLRAGPGVGFETVHQLANGEIVQITGRDGSGFWLKIDLGDRTAWAGREFIETEAAFEELPVLVP